MQPLCNRTKSDQRIFFSFFFLCVAVIGFEACNTPKQKKKNNESFAQIDSTYTLLEQASFNAPDSVVVVARQLILKSDELNYTEGKARGYLQIAAIKSLQGQYDSSLALARKAKEFIAENTLPRLKAEIANEVGVSHDYKGNYKAALENYKEALQYFEDAKDTSGYVRVKNNIGLIYQNMGEKQTAKRYFEEAYQLSKKKNFQAEEIMALSNLGAVENELGLHNTALVHFRQVLYYDSLSGNETYISYSYNNLAEVFMNMKAYDSAAYYFQQSIVLKRKLDAKGVLVNSLKNYGRMLLEQGLFSKADSLINEAFTIAKAIGVKEYEQECYQIKADLAEKLGNYKSAFEFTNIAHAIKDSLEGAKYKTELITSEKDYELALKNISIEKEKRAKEKVQSQRWILILASAFLVCFISILTYLYRKQIKLNKLLQIQKQQIEEGLQLRNKFLSFLTHEIRNPLSGIIGMNKMLLDENPSAVQKEFLQYQLNSSRHLLHLLNDVLDYQKIGTGKVEIKQIRFSMRDIIHQVQELYQAPIKEKNIQYHSQYDSIIPEFLIGDPVRLSQIFGNLVNNAIKFTPEGGSIFVTVTLMDKSLTEATLLASVRDTGMGIAPSEQTKIFELFVQSSKNQAQQLGTGLGLSIVKDLLALMHSYIELQSEVGRGSTFSFKITLPIAP
jgi:signal transduction histidine kinase